MDAASKSVMQSAQRNKLCKPPGERRSVAMDAKNAEIFVSINITDFLHFDHQVEMRSILRKNRRGRFLGGAKNPQQMFLVGSRAEKVRLGVLHVMEFIAGEIKGAVEKNSAQPQLIVRRFPSPQPVRAHGRITQIQHGKNRRVMIRLDGIGRIAHKARLSIERFHDGAFPG